MDAIFALAPERRARVLERTAARIPGCLYLCLWAPVIADPLLRSGHLFCLDAWLCGGGGRVRAAFEVYRGALCDVVRGCVPGWAYTDARAYMELPEPDLTASASSQAQQEFYHEAGTKMAVFMGCDSGEMEIGLSSDTSPSAAVADHVQQSLLEELMQMTPTTRPPSSSSSSLPSTLSIGSPEYSSLIRSMTTAAAATEPSSSHERQPAFPLQPAVQLPALLPPVYGGHATLPSTEAEEAAMAQAMLAVISSSSSAPPAPAATTSAPPPVLASPPWLARHRTSPRRRGTGAFRPYSAALSPRARPRPGAPGQRMVKTAIALMVSMHMEMSDRELAAARRHENHQQPTSSQLHHMISERRRRERLNESFQTLRALLPPGSKKDKATVLANTTEYMNKLIADVSDLQEKNRRLEAQLGLLGVPGRTRQITASDDDDDDDSSEKTVQVNVTTGASTSTSDQPPEVGIRVRVRAECDLSELVMALLAWIKEMGRFMMLTVDAEERSGAHAQVSITLRSTTAGGDELDETSLKEAVTKVVEDAVAGPPSPPPP